MTPERSVFSLWALTPAASQRSSGTRTLRSGVLDTDALSGVMAGDGERGGFADNGKSFDHIVGNRESFTVLHISHLVVLANAGNGSAENNI